MTSLNAVDHGYASLWQCVFGMPRHMHVSTHDGCDGCHVTSLHITILQRIADSMRAL